MLVMPVATMHIQTDTCPVGSTCGSLCTPNPNPVHEHRTKQSVTLCVEIVHTSHTVCGALLLCSTMSVCALAT